MLLRINTDVPKSKRLLKTIDKVKALEGLSCGAFTKIIDRRVNDEQITANGQTELTAIGSTHREGVRRLAGAKSVTKGSSPIGSR